jgi:CO/xanthine dehydrogenase Mo-binding subunit
MGAEMKTVGRSELRKDAVAKVSGAAQYAADIPLKGVHWGAVLRSPHHHARIVSLETATAKQQADVMAVITAADVPGSKLYAALFADQPALAGDVVRHKGEPVALVVAKTRAAAEKALKLIRVEYEELPAVFDPLEALLPGAPKVHPGGNLLTHYDFTTGDPAAAFAGADIILEETFNVPRISPGYMEPETSLACWNADGSLTVWVSSQKPFVDRSNIAGVLSMPAEQVQVISAVIGGAFGGKEDSGIAVLAGLCAWAVKGSVRLVNNRSDSFLAHPKRHPAVIRYRMAADKDGTLLGVDVLSHMDTGAYASYGPAVAGIFTEVLCGSYRIPNVHVDTRLVYTNCPFSGAMRGFGSPQAHFAVESMIDILASRLGMDPLEVRRKNMLRPGDCFYTGVALAEGSALSLERILEEAEMARQKFRQIPAADGKRSGVGFALAVQTMGLGAHVQDDSTNRLEWRRTGHPLPAGGCPSAGYAGQSQRRGHLCLAHDLPGGQFLAAGGSAVKE